MRCAMPRARLHVQYRALIGKLSIEFFSEVAVDLHAPVHDCMPGFFPPLSFSLPRSPKSIEMVPPQRGARPT